MIIRFYFIACKQYMKRDLVAIGDGSPNPEEGSAAPSTCGEVGTIEVTDDSLPLTPATSILKAGLGGSPSVSVSASSPTSRRSPVKKVRITFDAPINDDGRGKYGLKSYKAALFSRLSKSTNCLCRICCKRSVDN